MVQRVHRVQRIQRVQRVPGGPGGLVVGGSGGLGTEQSPVARVSDKELLKSQQRSVLQSTQYQMITGFSKEVGQ